MNFTALVLVLGLLVPLTQKPRPTWWSAIWCGRPSRGAKQRTMMEEPYDGTAGE